jgi:hypothetical protein
MESIPANVRILMIFVLILLAVKRRWLPGNAFLCGSTLRMLKSFEGLIRKPRVNLVILPVCIGILPMPGGAIFSAPMVKSMGMHHNLSRPHLSREMLQYHIPSMPICMILPFSMGSIAGVTIAFVGMIFSILISLIQTLAQTQLMVPCLILALACGFIGVLLSPLRLCLLLTNAHFETEPINVYRYMRILLGVMLIASVAYFGVLHYVMT